MIARTRTLQFKQFDSDPDSTTVRLTDPDGKNGHNDLFVVIRTDGKIMVFPND